MESFDELLQKAIRDAVNPLQSRIEYLETRLLEMNGQYRKWVKMSVAEKRLSLSARQITRLIQSGVIKKAKKNGRPWVFDDEELRFLETHPEKLDLSKLENYGPMRL